MLKNNIETRFANVQCTRICTKNKKLRVFKGIQLNTQPMTSPINPETNNFDE